MPQRTMTARTMKKQTVTQWTMTQLVTVPQAADRLKVSPATIRKWIFYRRLPFVKVGRSVRLREADVEALISFGLVPAKQEGRR